MRFEHRWQKEILEKLETSLAEAEERMEAAEERNEALDLAKLSLEAEVKELEARREGVISRMSSEEQQVVRCVTWNVMRSNVDWRDFQDELRARTPGEEIAIQEE